MGKVRRSRAPGVTAAEYSRTQMLKDRRARAEGGGWCDRRRLPEGRPLCLTYGVSRRQERP